MAYSYLDLAYDVLKTAKQPLIYQEIWELAKLSGLSAKIKTSGKTPWQSLGAQLYVDVRDNEASKFIKVGKRPARFFPKDRQSEISAALVSQIDATRRMDLDRGLLSGREWHKLQRPVSHFQVHGAGGFAVYLHPQINLTFSVFGKRGDHGAERHKAIAFERARRGGRVQRRECAKDRR